MRHLILIPTYNESQNIEALISLVFNMHPEVFVRVIDDNSPDGTADIVKDLMGKYSNLSILEREQKEGLGKAYIHAFREVLDGGGVSHITTMDADFSHDPMYLKEMIEQSKNADLVIGSRYVPGGKTIGWEAWRRGLSKFGNIYSKIVTQQNINDLTGGFNTINIDKLREVNLNSIDSSGYAFQIELKYVLSKKGALIKEIPIIFKKRIGGESKMSNHIISEGLLAPWKMILK